MKGNPHSQESSNDNSNMKTYTHVHTASISQHFYDYFLQKHEADSSNFDSDFTSERAQLTPPDKELLKTMNQHVFKRFSFTSAEAAATWSCPPSITSPFHAPPPPPSLLMSSPSVVVVVVFHVCKYCPCIFYRIHLVPFFCVQNCGRLMYCFLFNKNVFSSLLRLCCDVCNILVCSLMWNFMDAFCFGTEFRCLEYMLEYITY